MGWIVINSRIAFSDGEAVAFPSASDIFALNRGDSPADKRFESLPAPVDELEVRFSRLSALIRVIIEFDDCSRDILLKFVAIRGNNEQEILFINGDLPDSILIADVWHNLQTSQAMLVTALKKAKIQNDGVILLNQYAALK